MATDNDAVGANFSGPIRLPLMERIPSGFLEAPAYGASTLATLAVQLDKPRA